MSEPRGELLIMFELEHRTFSHWQRNKGICAMPGQRHGKCRCSANQIPWTHSHGTCLQCQEASSRHKTQKPIFSLSTSSALCLYALSKSKISNLKCAHAWSPRQYLGPNGSQFTWLRHVISSHCNSDLRVLTRYSILPANIPLCPPCRYILCICPYLLEIYFHIY
jgi:hypothetical protein